MIQKRIGLFLSSKPSDGGVYQYNLSMLHAVLSLPMEEFQPIIVYTQDCWQRYLQSFNAKVYLRQSIYVKALGRLVRNQVITAEALRKRSSFIHPTIKSLQREHCNLWVFPSQDPMSYFGLVPSLVAVHDLMHRYERKFPEASANGLFEWREMHYKNICRFAKGILVDSEIGKQHLRESYGIDVKKVYVLPFVAPEYVFQPASPKSFDERYRLPERFIFYPAQFWEHKNHKNLIRAVHRVKSKIPELHLVLIGGKKNGYESVRNLVVDLKMEDSVHFMGFVPDEDISEFYRRAIAMIMPTFFGPTNILPLEAFALGCPCAVSDVYGMSMQVGDAALLFDPTNIESIAQTIQTLWLDKELRRVLVVRGRARSERWKQHHFSKRLQDIIKQVLQEEAYSLRAVESA